MFKKIKNRRNVLFTINDSPFTRKGQVILEFTFCMIVILIMIYGVIKVFHWAGRDLVERQRAHEATLVSDEETRVLWSSRVDPKQQIDPYFYDPIRMDAIWDGK